MERGHFDVRASLKRRYVSLRWEERERAFQCKVCGKNIQAEQTASTVVSPETRINWPMSTGSGPSEWGMRLAREAAARSCWVLGIILMLHKQ